VVVVVFGLPIVASGFIGCKALLGGFIIQEIIKATIGVAISLFAAFDIFGRLDRLTILAP